jgi:putative tributyrin esterase
MLARFSFSPETADKIKSVALAGSFNGWSTSGTLMKYNEKRKAWEHTEDLQEGYYPYKFQVNGEEWYHDPLAKRFEQNEVGSINSVAIVSPEPQVHATFAPLTPSCEDVITLFSEKPASLLWSLNGWHPWPKGYLKNTIPNLDVNVQHMEKSAKGDLYETTIGPFNKRKIPEVIVYNFVFADGSVDDNYGKNYWLPLFSKLKGECKTDSFISKALDRERPFRIYVPPNPGGKRKFPLLLLLHGYGGTYLSDWTQAETVKILAEKYGIICVWPDGGVWVWGETVPGWYINSPRVPCAQMEDYIIKELIPYIEATYPCNGTRAIGGISMGGFGALYLASKYHELFRAAGSFSAIYNLYRYRKIDALRKLVGDEANWKKNQFNVIKLVSNAQNTDFFFLIGDEERGALRDNFTLKLAMDKAGIRNDFRIYPGNHTNNFWRIHIQGLMEFFAQHLGCDREG